MQSGSKTQAYPKEDAGVDTQTGPGSQVGLYLLITQGDVGLFGDFIIDANAIFVEPVSIHKRNHTGRDIVIETQAQATKIIRDKQ